MFEFNDDGSMTDEQSKKMVYDSNMGLLMESPTGESLWHMLATTVIATEDKIKDYSDSGHGLHDPQWIEGAQTVLDVLIMDIICGMFGGDQDEYERALAGIRERIYSALRDAGEVGYDD
jgi:hypothetical protein